MKHPDPTDRLESWKAIANYLDRSVRTVKRWEVDEGLPVHRHLHQRQATVFAFPAELDRWRSGRSERAEALSATTEQGLDSPDGVLVLPFDYIGPDLSRQWLADGFSEALIADLAAIEGLRVLSRTSSRILRQRTADARTIGRRHGVLYLVEGGCRCIDVRLRVSVSLIDIGLDASVWSESFDGTVETAFDLQSEIAAAVSRALEHSVGRTLKSSSTATQQGEDVATWQCLILARQQALSWRADGLDAAVAQLEQGLRTLGERPSLLAALGRSWLQYRESAIDLGAAPLDKAAECATRLANCAPDHPGALQLRGWLAYSEGRVSAAIEWLVKADQAQPNDPETLGLLINCLLISDRAEQARPLIEQLLSIDPLSPLTACLPGWDFLLQGQFECALPHYERMHAMDPAHPMGRLFLIWARLLANRKEGLKGLAEPDDARLVDHPALCVARFLVAASAGEADAQVWLNDSVTDLARASEMIARFLANGYALLGDAEAALRWLEVAIDRGFAHRVFLQERDPLLRPLHGMPGFQRLLERIE